MEYDDVLEDFIAALDRCSLLVFPPDVIVAALVTAIPAFKDAPEDAVQEFANRLGRALRARANAENVLIN